MKLLCVGGPLDGRSVPVPHGQEVIQLQKPMESEARFSGGHKPCKKTLKVYQYRRVTRSDGSQILTPA